LLAAPVIGAIYGYGGLAKYFILVAVKQPVVGAALIPLAMMNRDLHYQRIAIVNVCATIAAALTRLGLGAAGAGTWALVAGYTASGLFVLIGASIARPFRPRLRFDISAIRPMMRFGLRAAVANIGEQMFKNVDYLLIGWFYGASPLAVYRVAFDVAMEPAMAAGTLINRTALPVFARVSAIKSDLAATVTWSLQRIATLVAPLMVGIMLAAGPLTALIHDKQGASYAAAAVPLRILAAAALLRVTSLLLSSVMIGSGRPGMAARLSAMTLVSLAGGILAIGVTLRAQAGIIAVSALWLGIYPLVMLWGAHYLRRHWDIAAKDLARAFATPVIAICALVGVVEGARHFVRSTDARLQLGLVVLGMLATYAGLFLHARSRSSAEV
jgi:O-antigen/teichoic acid export membrane protein